QRGVDALGVVVHLDPVGARHCVVGDHRVEAPRAGDADNRVDAVAGGGDGVAAGLHRVHEKPPGQRTVVGDEYLGQRTLRRTPGPVTPPERQRGAVTWSRSVPLNRWFATGSYRPPGRRWRPGRRPRCCKTRRWPARNAHGWSASRPEASPEA